MARQESRRTADHRFHNIGPALSKMAQHAERTIRRLAQEPDT